MTSTRTAKIPITGDTDADLLLQREPLALLIGMLLDQQISMELAFKGPARLRDRLGGRLDAAEIADLDPDLLTGVFSEKPALHRFPKSMATRTQQLCQHLVDHYGGDAGKLWKGARSPDLVLERLRALPGYGDEKARILLAVLGKRLGKAPAGWELVATPFGDEQPRSVADVADAESLQAVRAWKKAKKAAGRSKQD